jgi:glycosyltransferase involved in cell wall biosynthesis
LGFKVKKLQITPLLLIDVIIPAFNEENSIKNVINDIPSNLVRDVIVVDNNSFDLTSKIASSAGALVLSESTQGYGSACKRGVDYLKTRPVLPDVVVFLDADYSDYPEQLVRLVNPIKNSGFDMVLGSRTKGKVAKNAMPFQQRFGNWLATYMISLFFGHKFSDLGPFRAIKFKKLLELNMQDKTYGWTVEMQLKALKRKLKIIEIPVDYRLRIGESKISGTLKGSILAGYKIISTIFKYLYIRT